MKLEWTFTAGSYLDQLPAEERTKILHAVERLPAGWNAFSEDRLSRVRGDLDNLYALRVGADLRVLVQKQDDVISIVDVIRRSQVDGLRSLSKPRYAVSG